MVQTGDQIAGKYRILRELGSGGMGVVYLARHERLERLVAIKVLHAQLGRSEGAVTRFEREIKALASIKSVYVAHAIDADILEDGSLYLVMEYLEGRDLRSETKLRGCIPPNEAVAYVIQACEGVAAAHDAGIIHRDLKPHNLFVTQLTGARLIKVLDFGVAKFLGSSDPGVTATDVAVGTPLYMSPEQLCRPDEVSPRSDVWALGVVLYEIIAGTSPFAANMPGAVVAAVTLEDPIAIERIVPEVSDGLAAVISDALIKAHERRIPSVRELAERLKPFSMPTDAVFVAAAISSQRPVLALERASARPDISKRIQDEIEAFDRKSLGPAERATVGDALRKLPSLEKLSIPLTKPAIPGARVPRAEIHDNSISGQSIPVIITVDPGVPKLHNSGLLGPVLGRSIRPPSDRKIGSAKASSKRPLLGALSLFLGGAALAVGVVWVQPKFTANTNPEGISSTPNRNEVVLISPPLPTAPQTNPSTTSTEGIVVTNAPAVPRITNTEGVPSVHSATMGTSTRTTKAAPKPTSTRQTTLTSPPVPPVAADGKPLHL